METGDSMPQALRKVFCQHQERPVPLGRLHLPPWQQYASPSHKLTTRLVTFHLAYHIAVRATTLMKRIAIS